MFGIQSRSVQWPPEASEETVLFNGRKSILTLMPTFLSVLLSLVCSGLLCLIAVGEIPMPADGLQEITSRLESSELISWIRESQSRSPTQGVVLLSISFVLGLVGFFVQKPLISSPSMRFLLTTLILAAVVNSLVLGRRTPLVLSADIIAFLQTLDRSCIEALGLGSSAILLITCSTYFAFAALYSTLGSLAKWWHQKWLVSDQRIETSSGFLSMETNNCELWRVVKLVRKSSLLERLLGLGRIEYEFDDGEKRSRTFTIGPILQSKCVYLSLCNARRIAGREAGAQASGIVLE